tara:strand:+ start:69 stop:863 length:795 start_codon:yes stop_codon:yes gene_type:complete
MFKQTKKANKLNNLPKAESDIYAEKYCEVLKTNNYNRFHVIDGNRPVRKAHLQNVYNSIAVKQIPVPIVVNETYGICDGQNRFEACKLLNKPIYYIVIPELTLEDVQRLNANTKTWQTDDFLDSFCELGYKDYLTYRDFKKEYKLSHNECMIILNGWHTEGKRIHQNFRDGEFKITNYADSIKVAEKIKSIGKYYDGYTRKVFVSAMLFLFNNDDYDHNRFLKKLSLQTERMVHQPDRPSYLKLIESIYNYKVKADNRIRLFVY